MLARRLCHPVVGRDGQEAVVEFLADEAADGRPEPRLVADGVDEGDEPVGFFDDPRAVVLPVRVVHAMVAVASKP